MSEEFLVRDTRKPKHFWADNEVYDFFGPELGAYGFAVYMALCRTAMNGTGECRIARSYIARQLSISKSTVHEALETILSLKLAKLLDPGGPRTTALYLLADVKALLDPDNPQMKLASSVRIANAEVIAQRSPGDPQRSATDPQRSPGDPRNKEDKTFSKLNKTKSPQPPLQGGALTPRQLKNLAKEMDRIASASVGARITDDQILQTACYRLVLPYELAKEAVARSLALAPRKEPV